LGARRFGEWKKKAQLPKRMGAARVGQSQGKGCKGIATEERGKASAKHAGGGGKGRFQGVNLKGGPEGVAKLEKLAHLPGESREKHREVFKTSQGGGGVTLETC